MIDKRSQAVVILFLLALLFYVNIPPTSMEFLSEEQEEINLTPYNITINQTLIITDFEGNIVETIITEINKTITPESPEETNILLTLSQLGEIIFPSQPTVGWILIFLLAYFGIFPILKWVKDRIWG